MKAATVQRQARIYLDFLSPGDSTKTVVRIIDDKNITALRDNGVKTVFMVTSEVIELDSYIPIVRRFEGRGLAVRSVYIETLDPGRFLTVKETFREICARCADGNALILFYGGGFSGALIAGFLMLLGRDADGAISAVNGLHEGLIVHENETRFLREFQAHLDELRAAGEPVVPGNSAASHDIAIYHNNAPLPAAPAPAGAKRKSSAAAKAKSPRPAAPKKPHPEKTESGAKTAPVATDVKFWFSLRFKLVSIISFIIVASLSSMIFVATYFSLGDNKIRVQENNHKVSEIIALKVKSDFQTIIDKSRIIASFMGREGARRTGTGDAEAFINSDREIIATFIETKAAETGRDPRMKAVYNTTLINRHQINRDDLPSINAANAKIFAKAFDGDTVVHNVSQGFNQPVIAIAAPYLKDRSETIVSILVTYFRLDAVLKAFEISGITRAFMVNERGDIIAHPDGAIVVSGGNYLNLPIVTMMIKSKVDNGQTRYRDENRVAQLGSYKKIGLGGCGVIATVEEAKAFEEVYNIQRRNIYLMVIVLTVSFLIVFFFGRTITEPVIRLVGATKRIKEGDYLVDISATTRDEIGALTTSFVEMGSGLAEREKLKSAFGKFVNKEIAEAVLRGDIRLGGERKTVAVLFSDIRSFTSISEKLQPEEVVEFLNQYMSRMVDCVNRTNGTVDKYIGDAIMAIWGAPVSKGNDAENAVNGALLMRAALIDFNKERGGDKKPIIKIGCGINVGQVLAGQIGSEERMEYTVIGDAVNLASRIEALNKPFGTDILITQDTYELVKDVFRVEPMQTIKVKGKVEPQQIYAVLGRTDDPTAPRSLDAVRALMGIEMKGPIADHAVDEEEVKYEIIEK